jgi:hypothetical protein
MTKPTNKVVESLDKKYDELDEHTATIKKAAEEETLSLQMVRSYLDRWEGIKADAFRLKVKSRRQVNDATFAYEDSMRGSLKQGVKQSLNGGPQHYDERRARYETEHLPLYSKLRERTETLEEIETFLKYIRDKEYWLGGIRYEYMEADKRQEYKGTKEYLSQG